MSEEREDRLQLRTVSSQGRGGEYTYPVLTVHEQIGGELKKLTITLSEELGQAVYDRAWRYEDWLARYVPRVSPRNRPHKSSPSVPTTLVRDLLLIGMWHAMAQEALAEDYLGKSDAREGVGERPLLWPLPEESDPDRNWTRINRFLQIGRAYLRKLGVDDAKTPYNVLISWYAERYERHNTSVGRQFLILAMALLGDDLAIVIQDPE